VGNAFSFELVLSYKIAIGMKRAWHQLAPAMPDTANYRVVGPGEPGYSAA
jgi:hypothetical protein